MRLTTNPDPAAVTQWLQQLGAAWPEVSSQLFERALRRAQAPGAQPPGREAPGHTLSTTALVHEAWFRMAEQNRTAWQSCAHFLSVSSIMMRRILVSHEGGLPRRQARGRPGAADAGASENIGATAGSDVVAVHEALGLRGHRPRAAKVVELLLWRAGERGSG